MGDVGGGLDLACSICTDKETKHGHPFRGNRWAEEGRREDEGTTEAMERCLCQVDVVLAL